MHCSNRRNNIIELLFDCIKSIDLILIYISVRYYSLFIEIHCSNRRNNIMELKIFPQ